MYLNVISCDVFRREMYFAASRSKNKVDLSFLCQGLHDVASGEMRARVQSAVDASNGHYDAVCLGYGLCNNGLAGIVARGCPLVIPRVHDCIAMFLGSKERYIDYFYASPGTYFKTTGWLERSERPDELNQLSISKQSGMDSSYAELVTKYGDDNARYLYETLVENAHNYSKLAYIKMGVEPSACWECEVRDDAIFRKWDFETVDGDMRLIQGLLDGEWNPREYLVVAPGRRIIATYNDTIIDCEDES